MKTICWKCKTKYDYIEDKSGTTHVTCPKCGTKGVIRKKGNGKEPINNKKPLFSTNMIVFLIMIVCLLVMTYMVISLSGTNGSLNNDLVFMNNNMTELDEQYTSVKSELNYTNINLTNTQDDLLTTQSVLSYTQAQLSSTDNALSNANSQINETNTYVDDYYHGIDYYVNATEFEQRGDVSYNLSETFYFYTNASNISCWENASIAYNNTKANYSDAIDKYRICNFFFNNASTHTEEYDKLIENWTAFTSFNYEKVRCIYNVSNYMSLACQYYLVSNITAGNSYYENATTNLAKYYTMVAEYPSKYNKLKTSLKEAL